MKIKMAYAIGPALGYWHKEVSNDLAVLADKYGCNPNELASRKDTCHVWIFNADGEFVKPEQDTYWCCEIGRDQYKQVLFINDYSMAVPLKRDQYFFQKGFSPCREAFSFLHQKNYGDPMMGSKLVTISLDKTVTSVYHTSTLENEDIDQLPFECCQWYREESGRKFRLPLSSLNLILNPNKA